MRYSSWAKVSFVGAGPGQRRFRNFGKSERLVDKYAGLSPKSRVGLQQPKTQKRLYEIVERWKEWPLLTDKLRGVWGYSDAQDQLKLLRRKKSA